MNDKQLTEIAKTLAIVETEVKGINKRLDREFTELNHTQEKQWSTINKSQLAIGKVMERTHLSPCNPLQTHSDNEGAHGSQTARIEGKTAVIVAVITIIGGSILSGLIQSGLAQAITH